MTTRLPPWFRTRLANNLLSLKVRNEINNNKLHTVCQSAACPNQTECWNSGTTTFLILGNICTRNCRFCNIPTGKPVNVDDDEPNRVARVVAALQLSYAVVTSVTRDDLPDGGASHFAKTIREIRSMNPGCRIEVLIPDFHWSEEALIAVLVAEPDILNHNIETVPSLYSRIRPGADYGRSLELLTRATEYGSTTKTGLMLGLGETIDELRSVMDDLRNSGCSILTLGQYLRPGKGHLPVEKYYHPDEFTEIRLEALSLGFNHVVSGPHVRSSYRAELCKAGDAQ